MLENIELMVDLDAYRLEALARGVMPVSARRRGNPRFDGLDELSRGLDGAELPTPHDLSRDLVGELLLTVYAKDPGEVGFVIGVDDLSCV